MVNPILAVEIATILSIIGSCITISSYLLFSELRSTTKTYVVWLGVGSIGYSLVTFMRYAADNNAACIATAIIESYFNLVTLFTTVVIAHSIRLIFSSFSGKQTRPIQFIITPWQYIFVWIVPILFSLLPLSTQSYGQNRTDKYCWIKTDTHNHEKNHIGYIWEGVILYFLVVAAIGYNAYIYVSVILKVNKWKSSDRASSRIKGVVKRMAVYPLILTTVYLFPFVHRVLEPFNIQPYWLVILSATTLKLQGFLDALAYGLTPAVVVKWKTLLRSLVVRIVLCSPDWLQDNDHLLPALSEDNRRRSSSGESNEDDTDTEERNTTQTTTQAASVLASHSGGNDGDVEMRVNIGGASVNPMPVLAYQNAADFDY